MSLSDLEATLLRAGAEDAPGEARKRAARAALMGVVAGATVGAAGTASAATTADAGATAGAASPSVAPVAMSTSGATSATGATGLSFVKVIGLAALAIGGASAGAWLASEDAPAAAEVATTTITTRMQAPPPAAHGGSETVDVSTLPPAAPLGSAAPAASAVRLETAAPVHAATQKTSTLDPVAAEARLLERARACLREARIACAVARLDEHATRFPAGVLRDEADLLGIEAARRAGDIDGARRRARDLLARAPEGPYAARARAVLEALEPPASTRGHE